LKTVANTTPIISLCSIGRLDILEKIFGEIIISEAVYQEIKAKESYGYKEIDSKFIKVEAIQDSNYLSLLLNQLDAGEAETIILAKELKADNVIIDENLGYRIAKNSDMNVIRTLSILLKAKNLGIVGELKLLLDELVFNGRWYSKNVYYTFLKKAGEI